jgi:beta-glucanase (GH16 family)
MAKNVQNVTIPSGIPHVVSYLFAIFFGVCVFAPAPASPDASRGGGGENERPESWVRAGELGPKPKHITDTFPLSDQSNKGNWQKYELLSDEFEGAQLDPNKWWPNNPEWLGRQPAYFYPGNVQISDGKLNLTMKKQEVSQMPKDKGYHTYTSAAVKSKTRVRYGYFEVKAKPMKSHGSSSFWFYDSTPEQWTEIDIFEIGGGAPGFERKYNMTLHVFHTPTEKKHWSMGAEWIAPSDLADDYHIYGLEWDRDKIKWYFDGVLVRWVENTHWHQPLTLNFDSETMPEWFGLPRDSDLPSTYSIEYVRVWQKQQADSKPLFLDMNFRQGFLLMHPTTKKGREIEAVLDYGDKNKKPVWRLCQWGTRYSLASSQCIRHPDGDISYENEGKKVLVGVENSESRDIILEVKGSSEYGRSVRKYGESWPHLLVEQDAPEIYTIDKLEKLTFELALRLLYCKNHIGKEDYNPQLHTAQFQMFLVIKNVNSRSKDYENYFWFGVPFFDDRDDIPPKYVAKDAGKEDATGKLIYTIDGKEVNNRPLKEGRWITIQKDLLPYIKEGLKEAVHRGHLSSDNLSDYAVVNMNMGWEIPGTFDASIQIKDLDITAIFKDNHYDKVQ